MPARWRASVSTERWEWATTRATTSPTAMITAVGVMVTAWVRGAVAIGVAIIRRTPIGRHPRHDRPHRFRTVRGAAAAEAPTTTNARPPVEGRAHLLAGRFRALLLSGNCGFAGVPCIARLDPSAGCAATPPHPVCQSHRHNDRVFRLLYLRHGS